MANEVRFRKPNTIVTTTGLALYTYLEFYGPVTTALVELYAYNSAGQSLVYPFTDSNSIQQMSWNGISNGAGGYSVRTAAMTWWWDNSTVKSQAVYFHCWLYSSYGALLDFV